jgi:hypothetical protein
MITLPAIRRRRAVRMLKRIPAMLLLGAVLACAFVSSGCNSSPGQFEGRVCLSILTIDNRQYFDGAATNGVAAIGAGHGSNARVISESIQSMVLYKSPMSASSNSTDVSASIPLIK